MDTPDKLSVHCVVMLVLSGLLISCPTAAEAEEARVCVNSDGFLLGSSISCTSGYLINVTGAEYLDLNSSLCGVNVCPCDYVTCRMNVDTVDGVSHYRSIISHCQYKPQCEPVALPRTKPRPCREGNLLLIRYTCIDEPPFPDTPATPPRVITTEGSPTSPTAHDSHVTLSLGTSQPTPGTSDVDPTPSDVTTAVSPVSGAMVVGLAVLGALMTVTILVLTVCLVLRKIAAKQRESAARTTPTATDAAWSSTTNHVPLPASPYETLETAPQAARLEGDGSATYTELTEAAAYMDMAAGRSREQSGSEPGGPERSERAGYVDMAAGRSREQSGSELGGPEQSERAGYVDMAAGRSREQSGSELGGPERSERAGYVNMAAGRSREQSGSEPGGPERSKAESYVNMAAGRSPEQSGSEPTERGQSEAASYLELI